LLEILYEDAKPIIMTVECNSNELRKIKKADRFVQRRKQMMGWGLSTTVISD